jgi:hypothetical protein
MGHCINNYFVILIYCFNDLHGNICVQDKSSIGIFFKHNLILIMYENTNIKQNKKNYGANLYLKLAWKHMCARQNFKWNFFKHNFILIMYKNTNIKWIKKNYGANLYLKLALNKLKVPLFISFYGFSSKEFSWRLPYVHYPRNFLESLHKL